MTASPAIQVDVVLAKPSPPPDAAAGGIAGWRAIRRAESEMADGLVRGAVADRLGINPVLVRLGRDPSGAPSVDEPAGSELAVSLSCGGGLVACAVAEHCPVGIDVERERDVHQWDRLAEMVLSRRERERVAKSGSPSVALMRLLSRKEAVLKAAGLGIGVPLASVDVLDDEVVPPGDARGAPIWTVRTSDVVEGWLLAVAAGTHRFELNVSWAPPRPRW